MIPLVHHDSRLRENSEVVIIYPSIYICIANLRYPAKKINSLLVNVDIPINTKRLKD